MDGKKLISPVALIGLFVAFGLVCLMVGLTKGKNAKWIARKMKIGGLILTFTSIFNGCGSIIDPPVVTCYDPIMPNVFDFDQMDQEHYQIVADLPNDSVLTGTIYERNAEAFSFEIVQNDSVVIQSGTIKASDGTFDSSEEKFELLLNSKTDTGIYNLNIIQAEPANEEITYVQVNIPLKIK